MIQTRHLALNYFLFLIATFILCALQSTVWFQITAGAPPPMFWLPIVVYFSLFRKPIEAVLACYGIGIVVASFSAISIGVLWLVILCVSLSIQFFKTRVFWPSTRYFVFMTAFSALVFHLSIYSLSHLLERNPASANFFTRFFEVLQTPLWAAPLFWLFLSLDRISQRSPLPESVRGEE